MVVENNEDSRAIIKDDEFETISEKVLNYCKNLEECLGQYDDALTRIATDAIPSGDVHDALLLYIEYVKRLEGFSTGIGDKFSRLVEQFIREIRAASGNGDFYLYSKDSDDTRDFTHEEYEALVACLDDPFCGVTDNIGDFFIGLAEGFCDLLDGLFNWSGPKEMLEANRRLWLDYNDVTLQDLNAIFRRAWRLSGYYGHSIGGAEGSGDVYTSYFAFAVIALADIRDMMDEMADIIGLSNGPFTAERISERLGTLYSEMLDDYMNFIAVPESVVDVTIETISDFVSYPWSDTYFSGFYVATGVFVADLGGLDAAKMVIFKMFDMGKDTAINGDYEAYIRKTKLMELIEEMAVEGLYSGSEAEEYVEDIKTILKYLKKGGQKAYDYLNSHRYGDENKLILDGRTIEARKFRELLDDLGDAKKYLEYGEKGIDYLSRVLADCSKGLEVLESFEANCQNDPEMLKTVQEIKALYSKETSALFKEGLKTIEEVGIDGAIELLKEVSPVVKVLDAIDGTIDKIGDITGLGTEAKSTYNAITYFNMSTATEDAYASAVQSLRAADPNSAEYEALAENVRNCFEIHKKNEIAMFENMADASYGTKKSYYRYCMGKAEQMSMGDTKKPSIMSYDEYLDTYGV